MKQKDFEFPTISKKLIECLKEVFPDNLPTNYVDSYELGVLVGQQNVIRKLEAEKLYQDNKEGVI